METLPLLQREFQDEYETTKKFFAEFPESKNDYAPHEKSMKMMPLASHIAEIFGWPEFIMKTEKLDFAAGEYQPANPKTREDLQKLFEEAFEKSHETLQNMNEEDLDGRWSINMGDQVIQEWSKYGAIRHALNQITHHRAQLGVYYRLNGIPLPASYGPSADDENF